MSRVRLLATTTLTAVAISYLEEALRCFNAGCHSAATLLLGVATEAVFLRLCDIVVPALRNPTDRVAFAAFEHIKPKHGWIVEKYRGLPSAVRRSRLPESLDMTLKMFHLRPPVPNPLGTFGLATSGDRISVVCG